MRTRRRISMRDGSPAATSARLPLCGSTASLRFGRPLELFSTPRGFVRSDRCQVPDRSSVSRDHCDGVCEQFDRIDTLPTGRPSHTAGAVYRDWGSPVKPYRRSFHRRANHSLAVLGSAGARCGASGRKLRLGPSDARVDGYPGPGPWSSPSFDRIARGSSSRRCRTDSLCRVRQGARPGVGYRVRTPIRGPGW
jgi:hypothetical protein